MTDHLRLSIDTWPRFMSLQQGFDYGSLQVLSLSNTSFSDCFSNNVLTLSGETTCYPTLQLNKSLRWSDGSHLTIEDIYRGIAEVLIANPLITKILLTNLRSIEIRRNALLFKSIRPIPMLKQILEIPNFAPKKGSLSLGDFILKGISKDKLDFARNPFCSIRHLEQELVTVHICKEPDVNYKKFYDGSIDVTCDTAFPYQKLKIEQSNPQFHQQKSGLIAVLIFGNRLAQETNKDIRAEIKQIVSSIDFSKITHGVVKPVKKVNRTRQRLSRHRAHQRRPYTLYYHDFYPNDSVSNSIKDTLAKHNIPIETRIDNYFDSTTEFDIKMMITRSYGSHPALLSSQFLLTPTLFNNARAIQEFKKVINEDQLDQNNSLSEWEDRFCPAIKLFHIPSLYLSNLQNDHHPLNRLVAGSVA